MNHSARPRPGATLNLRAGELVEVRSKAEILATLDATGRSDALPFMPEMLRYCGQQFRVSRRAHKTCDTIWKTGARRMEDAVHLDDIRCDGSEHGGCQAGCLVFWKEAWLKRIEPAARAEPAADENGEPEQNGGCSESMLYQSTRRHPCEANGDGEAFACQTTELFAATSPLRWWDVRQYVTDVSSGNVPLTEFARAALRSFYNAGIRMLRRCVFVFGHAVRGRVALRTHMVTRVQPVDTPRAVEELKPASVLGRLRTALDNFLVEHPHVRGRLQKTPTLRLDLQPGELVTVRRRDEILATLDVNNRNRGLLFDVEMLPYCGGTYRVLRRVEKILDERTGKILRIPNNCVVLDGVVCGGCLSRNRLFCPRAIYPYWHEIWLERAAAGQLTAPHHE